MFSFTSDHFQIVAMSHSQCRLKLNWHHVAHRRTAPTAAAHLKCVKLNICMIACINQEKPDNKTEF